MKIHMLTVGIIFFILSANGQNEMNEVQFNNQIKEFEKKISVLRQQINNLRDSISIAKDGLKKIELQKIASGETEIEGVIIKMRSSARLKKDISIFDHEYLCEIPQNEKVVVLDKIDSKYKVIYKGQIGYLSAFDIDENTELKSFLNNKEALRMNEKRKAEIAEQNRLNAFRKNNLIKKYGASIGNKIYDKKIWIGMTKEMLMDGWGNPREINRTVMPNKIREQCVYSGKKYVYLENGILTSWQD